MKNLKISLLIILFGVLISSFIFYKNNKVLSLSEEVRQNRFEDWKEIKIENINFLVPKDLEIIDINYLHTELLNPNKTLTIEKTKLKNTWFDNMEDWYKLNQERSYFWVRYYKILDKESKKITTAFIVRGPGLGDGVGNSQWVKFIDEKGYFYNITIRNFTDEELEYFMRNMKVGEL